MAPERLIKLRYQLFPDHLVGEVLSKRWIDNVPALIFLTIVVVVFGSLTKRGVFNAASDIDLALFSEPEEKTIFGFMAEIEERMRRPVDVLLLEKTRLKEKILREGEVWTT